jgi:mono/diheme cytochrome c family protein/glucose/arabinose dehydrogenase
MFTLRALILCLAAVASGPLVLGTGMPLASPLLNSQNAPVLPAAEAMKTFALPPGYRAELVASEPVVSDPVLIDWDADGRLWVVEMPAYMIDMRGTGEHTPNGRIVVLDDTDDDGRMDRRTVFADGLVLPRALKVLDRGVLVGEPPALWLMQDTDGDGRADTRTPVTKAYGRRDANVEHNANGLLWALDNRIYTSEVDTFFRWRGGALEERTTLSRGQWGLSQDDAGRVYRNTNSSVLHVDLVPTPYYARTAGLVRTRGSYESLATPENELNRTFPSRPTPGVNRGYQFGVLRPDGRLATFTGVGAPAVYRGDRLPADVYGNVFVAEPAGNLVARIIVRADEQGITAERAYRDGEFLTSTDERFRPVYLSAAPDGTLYVVDMYRGIIQHKGYITEYLRDQIVSRGLETPIGLGRIYRIVHDTTVRGPAPSLSRATAAELVATLAHPNGWWRDTAQRLLVERADASVVPALEAAAASAPDARTRLHALWTLDGMGQLQASAVVTALGDSAADVRQSAVRLAEPWLRMGDQAMRRAVDDRLTDRSLLVRRQLAASLGELPPGTREPALASMLVAGGGDPIVADATLSGMRNRAAEVLALLLTDASDAPLRRQALTLVAATLVRAGAEASVQELFASIADTGRAEWQRAALVAGAEVALLNAPAPGTPARRGGGPAADAPCATCPGGRAGPGGAPAFPSPQAVAAAAAGTARGGRGNDGPRLRLDARPALADAATAGPLGERIARVLARVEWPGKAGVQAAAPLTAAEQALFDTGKDVYENLCQACHQPDGRGLENVAPPLVGSALALGAPDLGIRVLLHGKEGTVGLMPPLGATLTDEQIAGSLTFIRRSWGHTASAVDPAAVKKVRDATAGRTRPWTPVELK